MYSRRNQAFGKKYELSSCESEQCKNVTVLGLATGPILNRSERLRIRSNNDEYCYRWQQILTAQYIEISVNGASTMCGFERKVIAQ